MWNTLNHPWKLRATNSMSGNRGKHSMDWRRTAIHVDDPLTIGEIDTVMRFYLSECRMLLGSMKSSIYLVCRYWRLGHCFVEAATEHYFEDAFARVGMTSCKSVVTPGVNDVVSNFLLEEARQSLKETINMENNEKREWKEKGKKWRKDMKQKEENENTWKKIFKNKRKIKQHWKIETKKNKKWKTR